MKKRQSPINVGACGAAYPVIPLAKAQRRKGRQGKKQPQINLITLML